VDPRCRDRPPGWNVVARRSPADPDSAPACRCGDADRNAHDAGESCNGQFGRFSPSEPILITRIRIPAIGVDAPVVVKGLDSERRMEAPDHPDEVAWYDFTALPGQGSNVVLAGHVDFAGVGPAVFWDLWRVRVGDLVELGLADGRVSRYRVTGLETVEERQAPVERIVGPTGQERLTLITCAGNYNPATGRYDQRLIVTATPLANP
jgi:LPXTG-site transpeptidase (sortase) family protein